MINEWQGSGERPIERVMDTAFNKMRTLVDANIIVGSPVETNDGASIIPINRITMGFLTGGGEYSEAGDNISYPFAGGSGGGLTVSPVCFLVSDGKTIKLVNLDEKDTLDKLIDIVPNTIGKVIGGMISRDKKK